MKGINGLKHRELLTVSLKIQGQVKHDIDPSVLGVLQEEVAELDDLYRQYLETLNLLEATVRDYEMKEKMIRSRILARSIRKLVKSGQSIADMRMVVNSLNSCAR